MKLNLNRLVVVLFLLLTHVVFSQEKTITGIVTDATGSTLPGVNVVIKGTNKGASTGFDGSFKIKVNADDTLLFTFAGMKSQELPATANMKVKMQDDQVKLKEVLVTSLGIKKKKAAITSSYTTVSEKELKSASNPDVVRSLIGKVSGVTINGTSNGVNGSNSIRIRSMLSFTGNTEALVVIDNVISNADVLATLPADAIENVTILKGAQGAALYGSQGKQGVVMVQTKKGNSSEPFVATFNSGFDIENINFIPERQQKYGQGWDGAWDQQENGGWGELFDGSIRNVGIPLPDGSNITAPYSARGNESTKAFYQTGQIFQNNLNLNFSGKDSFLNLNLGNVRRNFILDGDNLNRNTIVLNASKKINKLRVGGMFTLTNQRTKQANVNAQTSRADYTILTNLLNTASNIPIEEFKNRGLYGWNGYFQNPYWAKDNNRLNETSNYINLGLNADYELTKNISIAYNGSVQFKNNNQVSYANQGDAPATADGTFSSASEYYQSNFSSTYYYGDLLANFNYNLTEKVGLKFNIGQNMQYNYLQRISQGGNNLEIPYFYHITNVLNPAIPNTLDNRTITTTSTATFVNTDLNYEDYLFLNLTGRYEGNSVASKGNQFYFYPSAGASFIPTKAFESLKGKSTLSNLKVYANYSKVGSLDPVAAYETLNLANVSTGFAFPNTGYSYNDAYSITDKNIKPETYTTIEGGINLGFFNDKLTLDAAGFMTKTKDLITNASVSNASGLTYSKKNAGELEGKGIELELGFMPFNTPTFKWSGRLSYTSYDTKVIDAGDSDKVVLFDGGNSQIVGNISAVEGLSFPYITGTDWTRDQNGRVIVDAQGRPSPTSTLQNLAKVTPDYILGLSNTLEYKGVGLSFVMDYRTGHSFLSQTKYNLTWNGHLVESAEFDRNVGFLMPDSVIDDPSTPGVVDYIPNTNVLTGGYYTLTGANNRTQAYYGSASNLGAHNLIDATAFKVREISLSYSFPKNMLKKLGMQSLKCSVNARNAFVILAKSNKGYADPEASNQINSSTSSAAKNPAGTLTNSSRNGIGFIGDAQYPSTRTFGFSINTTF